MLWIDERSLPSELEALIDDPATPEELWKEIVRARDEIDGQGAVTYSTKARIETLYTRFVLKEGSD